MEMRTRTMAALVSVFLVGGCSSHSRREERPADEIEGVSEERPRDNRLTRGPLAVLLPVNLAPDILSNTKASATPSQTPPP